MPAITALAFDTLYFQKEVAICNTALGRCGAERIRDTSENTKQANIARENYAETRDELLRIYPANFAVVTLRILEDTAYPFSKGIHSIAYILEAWLSITGTNASGSPNITGVALTSMRTDMVGMVVTGANIDVGTRVKSVDMALGTIVMDRPSTGIASGVELHNEICKILNVNNDPEANFLPSGGDRSARILTDESTGQTSTARFLDVKVVKQVINPDEFDIMFKEALIAGLAAKFAIPLAADSTKAQQLMARYVDLTKGAQYASSEETVVDTSEGFWTDRRVGGGPSTRGRY